MKFTKMHGLGNDYVYVNVFEERITDPSGLAREVSDRHTGIGSDGLILIGASDVADVRMEMYNADGSIAQMCGNGIRCVAKFAYEHGLTTEPKLLIETRAGIKIAVCQVENGCVTTVRIDMGQPSFKAADLPAIIDYDEIVDRELDIDGTRMRMTCVSMGNPHAILFVNDLENVDLAKAGSTIEKARVFPERINVHFVQVDGRRKARMRTWERGSGATRACGTGACAVCVAGAATNRLDRSIVATLPGGNLEIDWSEDGTVFMTGPAVEVFCGHWPCDRVR